MAGISVECTGASWQDDVARVHLRLRSYFGRCFRGERHAADLIQEAVLKLSSYVARHWTPGATLRPSLRYCALDALRQEARASGRQRRIRADLRRRARRCPVRQYFIARCSLEQAAAVDLGDALGQLPGAGRRAVEAVIGGETCNAAGLRLGHDPRTVRQWCRETLARLEA